MQNILLLALIISYEIYDFILSIVLSCFGSFLVKKSTHFSNSTCKNYVVVCLYDKYPRPDLISLFQKFNAAGFGIIGVSSNNATNQYEGYLDTEILIQGFGRDFLAYKVGYRALKKISSVNPIENIIFLNDSLWFFEKYQSDVVRSVIEGLKSEKLVFGTYIPDEVPHASGWLFGLGFNDMSKRQLDQLFRKSFYRKSRRFNIRLGEHKIIPLLRTHNGMKSVDSFQEPGKFVHYGYTAISDARKCFYLKGDSTLRINPVESKLLEFLKINATESELTHVSRWISSSADRNFRSLIRRLECRRFQKQTSL